MPSPTALPAKAGNHHVTFLPTVTDLILFFLGSFLVAWGLWFAASLTPAAGPRGLLILHGTFAPGIVGLALTA